VGKNKKQQESEMPPVEDLMVLDQEQDADQGATETPQSLAENLDSDLLQAREEAQKHQDLYLRAMAEMDNLRKRTQREKEELAKFANENILRELLPVIDNLERAVDHAEQEKGNDGLFEGVRMTLTQFAQVLTRFGVAPVVSLGKPFDPALHQAIGQLETGDYPANSVAQEMQKGYLLNERLLRPALVMVAKAPAAPEKAAADNDPSPTTDEN
jgi:molecular chaperone GrpE